MEKSEYLQKLLVTYLIVVMVVSTPLPSHCTHSNQLENVFHCQGFECSTHTFCETHECVCYNNTTILKVILETGSAQVESNRMHGTLHMLALVIAI